ncbi:2-C-methyl-D-erythritol 4-phosphate cytidylyltransferase [Egibacter rhizosphaerae]|uniref:2-C-methyl-D-erythritol 4-phosphate cytidylyltransferase n=1 Tax=Egibacter rhizosphaerae TaxID=1670831 RepID=A0A411YDI6_9ACTN|nr:IspD/TarI family cytidylyltransferase [Egibacter rhizosphaerae]QBI19260.1 2-C-methyl-D-erythritol 4-phosphate cytidylyltransferase [Egibacter rhizosphaerae]
MTACAILLAGGAGTRLHQSENKVYLPVADRPLVAWSLDAFERSPLINEIVLVIREEDRGRIEEVLAGHPTSKVGTIVEGGATRHASEHAGLEAVAPRIDTGEIDLVLIHDGARPFVRQRLLRRIVETARAVGGAVPGMELDAPVLLRAGSDRDGEQAVLPTDDLRRVQTPQAFRASDLLRTYREAAKVGFAGVDTSESVERFSDLDVEVVPGDPDNIKVTFVQDLFAVEELAVRWPGEDDGRH